MLAKVSELYGKQGNVALAKDGLDLLAKISTQGGFVLQDHLKIQGYNVSGTVRGSIAGNNASPAGTATVLISTRFTVTSNPATDLYWQADYINTAIHEMLHLAGRFSGFSDRELAVAASQLPNAKRGLPDAPKGPNDFLGIAENSGYFDRELK